VVGAVDEGGAEYERHHRGGRRVFRPGQKEDYFLGKPPHAREKGDGQQEIVLQAGVEKAGRGRVPLLLENPRIDGENGHPERGGEHLLDVHGEVVPGGIYPQGFGAQIVGYLVPVAETDDQAGDFEYDERGPLYQEFPEQGEGEGSRRQASSSHQDQRADEYSFQDHHAHEEARDPRSGEEGGSDATEGGSESESEGGHVEGIDSLLAAEEAEKQHLQRFEDAEGCNQKEQIREVLPDQIPRRYYACHVDRREGRGSEGLAPETARKKVRQGLRARGWGSSWRRRCSGRILTAQRRRRSWCSPTRNSRIPRVKTGG